MLRRIPRDVFRDRILPYTYRPQPTALRDDRLSYHGTMAKVKTLYGKRFPTGPATPAEDSDLAWLSNDICRFCSVRAARTMRGRSRRSMSSCTCHIFNYITPRKKNKK